MSFLSIWERITEETDIEKLRDLAEIVDTTQPYVSRLKSKNQFPVDWAYKVGQKYNLLTEWIMTGKGPKRLSDQLHGNLNFPLLYALDQWLTELVVNEPHRRDWFKGTLEDAFPMFKEWNKRREEKESKYSESSSSKIA